MCGILFSNNQFVSPDIFKDALDIMYHRVPFVDHRLVELLAGAPFEWRMGKRFKEPLKRIFNKIIPQDIINRKKVGFPVPLDIIFKGL